ncbi:MAG: hypothetical protein IJH63_12985 [Methanobrevibacter sp.]|nr:hypothetical protein [Bacilli bacterium]MBQ3415279.1 hypothetical protein [Clostridia bacterium]MBR0058183.1 hypothetical protein [Methanobrevibacter sp.]MBR0371605.1 hypothetical protein [Methanobrevibacter sp.]
MAKKLSISQAKYDKENCIRISIKLHKKNDKDILDHIDEKNKLGSIKKLLRKGIENSR